MQDINIDRINGIIAELQRQNGNLSARCAELSGVVEELNAKLKALEDVGEPHDAA